MDESEVPKDRRVVNVAQPILAKITEEDGLDEKRPVSRKPGIPPRLMQLHNPPSATNDVLGAIVRPKVEQDLAGQDDII
jgi:hypothetical protein